jgi:hypothetical protein
MPDDTDVFISYAHADQEWVRVLAENLHQSGLNVFYDEWEIGAGDVLVHKLDAGILSTRNGIVVVSPTALSRPWVQEEYAAMLTRAVAGKQRLIPVVLKDAEMPPMMAARVWVDFRNADGPELPNLKDVFDHSRNTVGGSTARVSTGSGDVMASRRIGWATSHNVSPVTKSFNPVTATKSPALARSSRSGREISSLSMRAM